MAGSIVGEAWVAVGAQTDKVDDQVVDAFTKAGKKGADAFDDSVDKHTKANAGKSKSAGGSMAASFIGGFAGGISGPVVVNSLKGFVESAQESAKIGRLTEQVIASTGGAAGVTAKDVDKLTQSLSKKAGMDDEAIQSGENLLLQFKDIRNGLGDDNKIFDRTSALMVDMASKMGIDATGAAKILGKALNEPGQGLSRLRAQGVEFTKEQEDQIEAMNAAGDVAGAQKAILSALEQSYGGAAEAAATNSDRMKVAWENVQEQIGAQLIPIFEKFAVFMLNTVLPAVQRLAGFLQEKLGPVFAVIRELIIDTQAIFGEFGFTLQGFRLVLDNIFVTILNQFGLSEETVIKWADRLQDVIDLVVKAVDFMREHWELFALGLVLIGGPITATIAAIALIIQHFEGFKEVIAAVVDFTQSAVELMQRFWATWGDEITRVVTTVFNYIRITIENVMKIIQGIIDVVLGLIQGDWDRVWSGLGQIVAAVFDQIKALVGVFFNLLSTAIDVGMTLLSGLFDKGWEIIKAKWDEALLAILNVIKFFWIDLPLKIGGEIISAMGKLGQIALDELKKLPGQLVSVAEELGRAIAEALLRGIGDLGGAIKDKIGGALGKLNPFASGGNLVPAGARGGNFIPRYAGGTTNAALGLGIVGELGPELVQFGGSAAVFPADQFERQMARALASILGGNAGQTIVQVSVANVSYGDARLVGTMVGESVQRVLTDKAINVGVRQGIG